MDALRITRKLLTLSPGEWLDLLRAQMAIARASWLLRRVRIGDLVAGSPDTSLIGDVAVSRSSPGIPTRNSESEFRDARLLAAALNRVAAHGPLRPECLVRSIALRDLLATRGIPGVIRVGVRRDHPDFLAHAWVELDGQVLGDDPAYIAGFTRLERVNVR